MLIFLASLGAARAACADDVKPRSVEVIVDCSNAPAAAEWAQKAKRLVEAWYPKIAALLPSKGFTPPGKLTLVFKSDMKGVAYTLNDRITISAEWIARHPDDEGMVIHELTHVIQAYHGGGPGWLVEGVADYVRFFHFEPQTKVRIDPARAGYRDGYRTSAAFLDWIVRTRDKNFVRELNQTLRAGKYNEGFFRARTSRSVDELWTEFIASLSKDAAKTAPRRNRSTTSIKKPPAS